MSPTENDLRAALHDGEGDGIDPTRAMLAGERVRARRRTRLMNSVGTAVVVAAVATGGSFLVGHQSTDHGSSSGDRAAKQPPPSAANAAGGASAPEANTGASGRAPALSVIGCPSPVAGQSPPPSPSSGPLFTARVSSLIVCTFSAEANPTSITLTGADAQLVVNSLEGAPTTRPTVMCPQYRTAGERTVEFVGVTAGGASAGVVTSTLDRPACATVVTNGKTTRYGWHPPIPLLKQLARAQAVTGSTPAPVEPSGSPTK